MEYIENEFTDALIAFDEEKAAFEAAYNHCLLVRYVHCSCNEMIAIDEELGLI